MIMKANKQIGFIYKNNESIDKILKDGDVIFERGFLREKTSTTLPITFGGVGKDLKDYKIYGNTKQQILPDGYTQVDYIESSGNQYIDTGVNADTNLRVVLDMAYTNPTGPNQNVGAIKLVSGLGNARYHLLTGANSTVALWVNDSNNVLGTIDTNRHYYDLDVPNGKAIFDSTTINIPTNINDSGLNFWLFGRNSTSTIYLSKVKQWTCKMYYSNVLVRDFIPCYRNSDNEVGLYDLVNNVFYTNEGTGTFTYGSIAPTPDAPIEIVSCGDRTKNLFDKDSVDITPEEYLTQTGTTARDLAWLITPYIEVKSGENYVYQGITRAGNAPYSCYYDSSIALVSSFKQATGTNTITIPNGVSYVRFSIMNNNTYPDAQTFMIEKGSTATSYEPYGYKIPVNVRSENLYDKNKNTQNYYLDINGNNESNTSWDITDYIPVIPNNNYTYKGITNAGILPYCAYYDKNKNFVSSFKSETRKTDIIIPDNIYFVRFSLCKTSVNYNIDTFEIISNETTNIYLDEPLRKIEDYSDYIDFINFKIVRKIKEVILTGSETWALSTNFWSSSISDYAFLNNIPYSNKFKGYNNIASVTSFPNNTDNVIAFKNREGEPRIYIKATQFTTLANFKTWLSSNPVTVDYVLKTPTEEDIELPNIKLIEGNNTLNIETEITPSKVYIKYKSNN